MVSHPFSPNPRSGARGAWRSRRRGSCATRSSAARASPTGGGQPVLLIPGFMAGDPSLATMTGWLRRTGHHTRKAGIRLNVACSGQAVCRLEERLEELAAARGPGDDHRPEPRRNLREGARGAPPGARRGDRDRRLPDGRSAGRPPAGQAPDPGPRGARNAGAPGLFRHSCLAGGCCTSSRGSWRRRCRPASATSRSTRAPTVSSTGARALDPAADEHVEVRASHCGMCLNAETFRRSPPRSSGSWGRAAARFRRRVPRVRSSASSTAARHVAGPNRSSTARAA